MASRDDFQGGRAFFCRMRRNTYKFWQIQPGASESGRGWAKHTVYFLAYKLRMKLRMHLLETSFIERIICYRIKSVRKSV